MTLVLMAVGLLATAAGLGDDRIWYSDQCVQPGQHAHHLGHDRGRGRSDPDRRWRSCSASCGGSPKRSEVNAARGRTGRSSSRTATLPPNCAPAQPRCPCRRRVPSQPPPNRLRAPSRRARPSRRTRRSRVSPRPRASRARSARLAARQIQAGHDSDASRARAAGHVRAADGRTDRRSAAVAALAAAAGDAARDRGRARAEGLVAGRDAAARAAAPRAEQPMPRATPQVEPPKEKERFDLVWPDRGRRRAAASRRRLEPKLELKPSRSASPRSRCRCRPFRRGRARRSRSAEKRMPEILRKPRSRTRTDDPQVGRDRRHAVHALCRRLDRGSIAARHGEIRVGGRASRASRKAKLTRPTITNRNAGSARSRRCCFWPCAAVSTARNRDGSFSAGSFEILPSNYSSALPSIELRLYLSCAGGIL